MELLRVPEVVSGLFAPHHRGSRFHSTVRFNLGNSKANKSKSTYRDELPKIITNMCTIAALGCVSSQQP
jgi:hypothetical protein